MLRFSLHALSFSRLVLFIGLLFFPLSVSLAEDAQPKQPHNDISIDVDIALATVTATSKITLPPATELNFICGNLNITGAVLEVDAQTPLTLNPTGENHIHIPASEHEQTVYISWNLIAEGLDDNLVSDMGVTLAGLWHPLPDRDMTYTLQARLPAGFTGLSEGEVSIRPDKSGGPLMSSVAGHPLRSINFIAGPYVEKTRTMGALTLKALFFKEDAALADEYLDKAQYYMDLYQNMIGPYPYGSFSIVENRLPTGYGMPGFTLLGQAVVRLPFIKDTSLGHEILHSWFGNSVMADDAGGNWSEGLTAYLADHLYRELAEDGAAYRKEQLLRYDSHVPGNNTIALKDFQSPSDSQPLARQVRAVGYDKSSMVFHMLRRQIGDDRFFAGLRDFYEKNIFARAGWEEINESFSAVAGQDLTSFFDQWLSRTDIPRIAVSSIDVSNKNGHAKVSFTVIQKNDPPYSLDIPVTIQSRKNEYREIFHMTERQQRMEVELHSLPTELIIDQDYDLMRALTGPETPPSWSQFMGAANAIAVLPQSETEQEKYAPLLPMLENLGCDIIPEDELDNSELGEYPLLFLGKSRHSLGIFADPGHAPQGVTVDVRKNPLSLGLVAILLTSPDSGQTESMVSKLDHYGKYSFLYFEDGRIVTKSIAPSDLGVRFQLFTEPNAIRVPDIRSFADIIEEIKDSRIVYIGESHTDLGSHLLQLQIIQALYEEDPNLAIGMEMFPRSSQEALDGYINGTIDSEQEFLRQSGYFDVWGYDYRNYRDIIGYAYHNRIPIVGLNIDKEIVSRVYRDSDTNGLDEEQASEVPPERKLDEPGYRQRLKAAFSQHDPGSRPTMEKLGGFIQAQSIWDEAMAESIADYLEANPDKRMAVIAGNGHVYKDSAIPPRVARRIDVKQSVISAINDNADPLADGYKIDYLAYTEPVELEPAPKMGVVLNKEEIGEDPENTRMRITQISPHGKAEQSGLRENDLILTLDGQEVRDLSDIKIILLDRRSGDKVSMKVLRNRLFLGDREVELEVELSSPMPGGAHP